MKYRLFLFVGGGILLLDCSSARKATSLEANSDCSGSRFNTVDMKSYYSASGVIIPREYANVNQLLGITDRSRFTPTLEEIQKAEEILYNDYSRHSRHLNRIDGADEKIKKVRIYLQDFPRQYLGYINEKGDKIILINLLHRKESEIPLKQRQCWDDNFTLVINEAGFGTANYPVNLEAKTIDNRYDQ